MGAACIITTCWNPSRLEFLQYSGCAVRPGRQRPGDAFGFGADGERGILRAPTL